MADGSRYVPPYDGAAFSIIEGRVGYFKTKSCKQRYRKLIYLREDICPTQSNLHWQPPLYNSHFFGAGRQSIQ